MAKSPTSIRLSETGEQIWADLAIWTGASKIAVIERALRALARSEKLPERSAPPGIDERLRIQAILEENIEAYSSEGQNDSDLKADAIRHMLYLIKEAKQ